MNKLTIIGNLTRDPEMRYTQDGTAVCNFTVAVNRRGQKVQGQPEADFFRVSAWRKLGENCKQYLAKGRKVAVVGAVSLHTYTGQDGQTRAQMDVTADDVEFLTPKGEETDPQTGYTQVDPAENPFTQEPQAAQPQEAAQEPEQDELPF